MREIIIQNQVLLYDIIKKLKKLEKKKSLGGFIGDSAIDEISKPDKPRFSEVPFMSDGAKEYVWLLEDKVSLIEDYMHSECYSPLDCASEDELSHFLFWLYKKSCEIRWAK